jgi:hypothetical protein
MDITSKLHVDFLQELTKNRVKELKQNCYWENFKTYSGRVPIRPQNGEEHIYTAIIKHDGSRHRRNTLETRLRLYIVKSNYLLSAKWW